MVNFNFSLVAQGTLRFYRNYNVDTEQAWSSGIVEIYYSGSWGNICFDYLFGLNEATVICHQLSYSGSSSYSRSGISSQLAVVSLLFEVHMHVLVPV